MTGKSTCNRNQLNQATNLSLSNRICILIRQQDDQQTADVSETIGVLLATRWAYGRSFDKCVMLLHFANDWFKKTTAIFKL